MTWHVVQNVKTFHPANTPYADMQQNKQITTTTKRETTCDSERKKEKREKKGKREK